MANHWMHSARRPRLREAVAPWPPVGGPCRARGSALDHRPAIVPPELGRTHWATHAGQGATGTPRVAPRPTPPSWRRDRRKTITGHSIDDMRWARSTFTLHGPWFIGHRGISPISARTTTTIDGRRQRKATPAQRFRRKIVTATRFRSLLTAVGRRQRRAKYDTPRPDNSHQARSPPERRIISDAVFCARSKSKTSRGGGAWDLSILFRTCLVVEAKRDQWGNEITSEGRTK